MTPHQHIIELAAQFCEEGESAADVGAMLRAFQRAERGDGGNGPVVSVPIRSLVGLPTETPPSDGWVEDEDHQTVDGVRYRTVISKNCEGCDAGYPSGETCLKLSCRSGHQWRKVEA